MYMKYVLRYEHIRSYPLFLGHPVYRLIIHLCYLIMTESDGIKKNRNWVVYMIRLLPASLGEITKFFHEKYVDHFIPPSRINFKKKVYFLVMKECHDHMIEPICF